MSVTSRSTAPLPYCRELFITVNCNSPYCAARASATDRKSRLQSSPCHLSWSSVKRTKRGERDRNIPIGAGFALSIRLSVSGTPRPFLLAGKALRHNPPHQHRPNGSTRLTPKPSMPHTLGRRPHLRKLGGSTTPICQRRVKQLCVFPKIRRNRPSGKLRLVVSRIIFGTCRDARVGPCIGGSIR